VAAARCPRDYGWVGVPDGPAEAGWLDVGDADGDGLGLADAGDGDGLGADGEGVGEWLVRRCVGVGLAVCVGGCVAAGVVADEADPVSTDGGCTRSQRANTARNSPISTRVEVRGRRPKKLTRRLRSRARCRARRRR
jgi:hypothetical protein